MKMRVREDTSDHKHVAEMIKEPNSLDFWSQGFSTEPSILEKEFNGYFSRRSVGMFLGISKEL